MKKVSALIVFMGILALAACGSTGGSGDGGGGCNGGDGGSSKMDNSESTINSYLDGTMKASYWVQVHADAEVGQYWETTMDSSGMVMTTRWQVASKDGDIVIVENQNKMDSEYMVSDYVIAYQVDTTKEAGEVNVTAAWIGKPGEAGQEIEIMEKPDATCGGCAGEGPETESFDGEEIADGSWNGTRYITEWGSSWIAENGWFNGLVRSDDADGNVTMELSAWGDDAEPLLSWE